MRSCVLFALVGAACGGGGWLSEARVLVDGDHAAATDCRTQICRHNENTDLTTFHGDVSRASHSDESDPGPNSSLWVSRSNDHGKTWRPVAVIPAIDDRDLRDPSFYEVGGKLAIKALTRLRVNSLRDSDVDTISGVLGPTDIWQATLDLSQL
jgi:hypothetical protein